MSRKTKQDVESLVTSLRRNTGLKLGTEIWAPGDGATRYRLQVAVDDRYSVRDLGDIFSGPGEFYYALRLANDIICEMNRRKA